MIETATNRLSLQFGRDGRFARPALNFSKIKRPLSNNRGNLGGTAEVNFAFRPKCMNLLICVLGMGGFLYNLK